MAVQQAAQDMETAAAAAPFGRGADPHAPETREALGIALRTVDQYLEQVLSKLGVRQRSELSGLLQKAPGG